MKRNENLIPFSRDHHYGLLCVWKIRQGIRKNVESDRIRAYVLYFWKEHLEEHFKLEDDLLPEIQNSEMKNMMDAEHVEIRELISKISASADYDLLEKFAKSLQQHIRFEERKLFPEYEESLSEEQLEGIGRQLAQQHHPHEDAYPDEFWL
ncbi:hemerythrin domain-containing protein [Cruoricaptor ignavus]|uniref:hemerythrin domain-containing protein n=1 Tax=Cruoricaptor ignavus TaxID=1118202 RepID=UPI00370DC649